MKDVPPRLRNEQPESEAKKVARIAIKGVLQISPLGGALHDLIQERATAIRETVRKNDEERLSAFYERLLSGDSPLDPQVADAMLDSRDFHALLRACIGDIESEKVLAYSELTKAIATGRVSKGWIRHYILALRDMSAEELSCLQKAFIASTHPLIPSAGPYMDESHFLQPATPGTMQSIVINGLESKGFVHEGKLSSAGIRFIKACMSTKELSPIAIGYKAWSGQNVAILSYEIGKDSMDALTTALQEELRKYQMKSSIFAVNRSNVASARVAYTHAVLLVGTACEHLLRNFESLIKLSERIPVIAVSVMVPCASLPADLRVVHSLACVGREKRDVMNEVRETITTLPKNDERQ